MRSFFVYFCQCLLFTFILRFLYFVCLGLLCCSVFFLSTLLDLTFGFHFCLSAQFSKSVSAAFSTLFLQCIFFFKSSFAVPVSSHSTVSLKFASASFLPSFFHRLLQVSNASESLFIVSSFFLRLPMSRFLNSILPFSTSL